jgi:CheY-like chemotaxis protein
VGAAVLVAGIEADALPSTPLLQREEHRVEELSGARALLARLLRGEARLLLLGPGLGDPGLGETIRRIRAASSLRRVSILALVPPGLDSAADLLKAGANAVLQQPVDPARYESWVARLLAVPRRLDLRVPVQGEVLASPRGGDGRHFSGLTRNLSQNGMLLASPVRLAVGAGSDIDIELGLGGGLPRFRALGRVVREAFEVAWPYIGYGIEFLFVPPESQTALADFLARARALEGEPPGIHSTVKRETWIYEILAPAPSRQGWQAEIRRAPRDQWRPGETGPFYVVEADTPEGALRAARDFIRVRG